MRKAKKQDKYSGCIIMQALFPRFKPTLLSITCLECWDGKQKRGAGATTNFMAAS